MTRTVPVVESLEAEVSSERMGRQAAERTLGVLSEEFERVALDRGVQLKRVAYLEGVIAAFYGEAKAVVGMVERIDAIEPVSQKKTHRIWSHDHRAWWKPEEQGYTANLAEAGEYTREMALDRTGGLVPFGPNVMVAMGMEQLHLTHLFSEGYDFGRDGKVTFSSARLSPQLIDNYERNRCGKFVSLDLPHCRKEQGHTGDHGRYT